MRGNNIEWVSHLSQLTASIGQTRPLRQLIMMIALKPPYSLRFPPSPHNHCPFQCFPPENDVWIIQAIWSIYHSLTNGTAIRGKKGNEIFRANYLRFQLKALNKKKRKLFHSPISADGCQKRRITEETCRQRKCYCIFRLKTRSKSVNWICAVRSSQIANLRWANRCDLGFSQLAVMVVHQTDATGATWCSSHILFILFIISN